MGLRPAMMPRDVAQSAVVGGLFGPPDQEGAADAFATLPKKGGRLGRQACAKARR
jgi:hypothetical protein